MSALTIIKHFNVLKHGRPRLLPRLEPEERQPFRLQRVEKRFRDRIVVAIPFPAHALNDPALGQDFPEILRRVLAAPIRMEHPLGAASAVADGLV